MNIPTQKRTVETLGDIELVRNEFLSRVHDRRELGCIAKEKFSFPLTEGFIFGNSYMLYGLQNNPEKEEVVAIDNLLYLLWGQQHTLGKHTALVDDYVKVSNFKALNPDLENPKGVVEKASQKKVTGLEAIAKAHAPRVKVGVFTDFTAGNDYFNNVLGRLNQLYGEDESFKDSVLSIIPERLRERITENQSRLLADYTIQELAIILSHPSVKIGPITEKAYDDSCIDLNIGKRKSSCSFRYPFAGTPYTTPKGIIEPYNVTNQDYRVLITDTADDIQEKAERIHERHGLNERRRFDEYLFTIFEAVRDKKFLGTWLHVYSDKWDANRSNLYQRFEEKVLAPIQEHL